MLDQHTLPETTPGPKLGLQSAKMPISHRNSDSSGVSHTKFEVQYEHDERNHTGGQPVRQASVSAAERERLRANARLANPLARISHAQLEDMGEKYAMKHQIGDQEDIRAFQKGAVLAQDPTKYDSVEGLTPEEKIILCKEFTNRWSQPKLMYIVIVLCSTCAAVQGMGTCPTLYLVILLANHPQMRRSSMAVSSFTNPNLASTGKIRAPPG